MQQLLDDINIKVGYENLDKRLIGMRLQNGSKTVIRF